MGKLNVPKSVKVVYLKESEIAPEEYANRVQNINIILAEIGVNYIRHLEEIERKNKKEEDSSNENL